jgi:3-oxoacyl-[acyl-carrier-protein] synthase II
VIERASDARARGARAIVEIAGGSLGSDAFHETNLNPDPRPLSRLIDRAIERAGVDRDLVDHVNLHGTATRANDPLEAAALGLVFGDRVLEIACSANKAQLGHLLGAAGSVELAIACLAIRDGFVPPTLNLEELDPACRIDAVPGVGRPVAIRAALKLSLGFGGHLAAAILRRPEPTP